MIDQNLPLGFTLSMLAKRYYGAFTRFMEERHDLDKHFTILLFLESSKNKCTQQCICDLLHLDKVTMVRILDHLVEKGYIKRVENPEDRRERWVELTAKAKKEIPLLRKSVAEFNVKVLKGLSATDKKFLFNCFDKISSNVSALPANEVVLKYRSKKKEAKS